MREFESEKLFGETKVRFLRDSIDEKQLELKRMGQDPKDGELCLNRVKLEETLVEACRDCDVQIHLGIWVQGRKTNRTIWQLVPSEVSLRIAGIQLVLRGKAKDQRLCLFLMDNLLSNFECVTNKNSKWANFGKQNWRCGMNRT